MILFDPKVLAALLIAYLVWAVSAAIGLVLARRSPVATLGWLVALLALPYVGALVYVFFGPRRLHRKKQRYFAARRRIDEATQAFGTLPRGAGDLTEDMRVRYRQLAKLAEQLEQLPPVRSGSLDLYHSGETAFASLEQAIRAAAHHIHLEYYIWEPGPLGDRFRDLLVSAAGRGVAVKLIVDDVGSPRANERYFQPLLEAGGEVAWFNPVRLTRFRPTLVNFRSHRKVVIVDGRIGFVGGMNISDRQTAAARSTGDAAGWRDTHIRFTGPPVSALQRVFLEDWHFAGTACPVLPEFFPPQIEPARGPSVQIIASGPDDDQFAIQRFTFAALATARDSIRLTTPYFIPDEAILEALKAAALRGVEVTVLVPHQSDSRLLTAAVRSYFDELCESGVVIYEYGPEMLHAKTLVVDDTIATVGTANIDSRSFRLNFEVIAAIYDASVAREVATTFERDLQRACRHDPGRAQPWLARLSSGTARLLSPIL